MGEEELLLLFSAEKKKQNKRKTSALFTNKFHCLTRSQRQEFDWKESPEAAAAAAAWTGSSEGIQQDPQRPLVSTVQNSVEIQSAWSRLPPPHAQSP